MFFLVWGKTNLREIGIKVIFDSKDKCSKCFDSSVFIYVVWHRFMIFSVLFYSISTWGENAHIVSCGTGLHNSKPVHEPLLCPQGTEQTDQGSAAVNK